jgi:hypothetical protein
MKMMVVACALVGVWTTSAGAVDIDFNELVPCRPAAELLCDRSGGMTWNNLLRCGATLAQQSSRLDEGCIAVLVKFGQLRLVTPPQQASALPQR